MPLDQMVATAGPLTAAQLTAEINEELLELYKRSATKVLTLVGTNTLTGSTLPARPIPKEGMGYLFQFTGGNTGPATYNGLPLLDAFGGALQSGQLVAGAFAYAVAVGSPTVTAFHILTPLAAGRAPILRIYTGNATWTKPAGLSHVVVKLVSGGGAGEKGGGPPGNPGVDGSSGGTSAFGAHLSCVGGQGGSTGSTPSTAVGTGGDINNPGSFVIGAGSGGDGGDAGGGSPGKRGSDGGQSEKMISNAVLGATEVVSVGAGGLPGFYGSQQGSPGEPGIVYVYEYYS